ncbi:MAG: AmmeMemoRadiSam system protein B [Candidatus Brocadiae bacterium]|nr:AmmeMemoRadiSam system protein B [Candidatus Brocadiia bacterium]
MDKPRLRHIQAAPVRDGDRVLVRLSDPTGISNRALFVAQEALLLLSLLDGTRSMVDIQAELVRQTGSLVLAADIQQFLDQLDEALLLDTPRFRTRLRELQDDPVRHPSSAGSAYAAEPAALRQQLDALFAAEGLDTTQERHPANGQLVGLVAPHIDFERGGPSYAHAYAALAPAVRDFDLFVVLGTAHSSQDSPYILTRKHFETPLGTLPTAGDLVDALATRAGGDPFREELVHLGEHSIEFQVVFLQYLLGDHRAECLPILCGSTEPHVTDGQSPSDAPAIAAFLDALRHVVADSSRRACFIAGADLAHVGAHFGDDFDLTEELMNDVEIADRDALTHVENLDAGGFYRAVYADANARHLCGVPPIYTLLSAVQASRCDLLDYRQALDFDIGCAVTFASLALYA